VTTRSENSDTHVTDDEFIANLSRLISESKPGSRILVALAGPPAAGKTTLAQRTVDTLNTTHTDAAALVPMDGYHLDDELLVPRGWRPRKGAPHTFDVYGLASVLQRLRDNKEPGIVVPRFDRDLEIARAGAIFIEQSASVVLVEGLYLLLNQTPWPILAPLFDITAMIHIEEAQIEKRLQQRWTGYDMDAESITRKIQDNDLPNARMVYAESRKADLQIKNP